MVKGVCAGMVVLNPEYQDAHNQEDQSYIGTFCGFGLTDQSEIRKSPGVPLPLCLGEGFLTCYSTLGLRPKLKAEEISDGPAPLIYRLDRGILTSWV